MLVRSAIPPKLYDKTVEFDHGIYRKTILNIPVLTAFEKELHIDEYQSDLFPLFLFMRTMGILPLNKNQQGVWTFKFKSWTMLHSFALYITLNVLMAIFLHQNFTESIFDGFDGFTRKILTVGLLSGILLPVLTPFTWWPSTKSYITYWESWRDFQYDFRVLTKKYLMFKLRKKCLVSIVIMVLSEICVMAFFTYYLYSFTFSLKTILYYIIFLYSRCLAGTFLVYCYLNCEAITKAADETLHALLQDIAIKHNVAQSLSRYRVLWLQLSKIAQSLGTVSSYTYCAYILFTSCLVTMLVYCCALTINDWEAAMLCFMDATGLSCFLFILCYFGSAVTDRVGKRFSEEIVALNNGMNALITQEVNLFLKTIEHYPPEISPNGYVVVNKRLLVSLGSALVTYLVVLLQFYHSAE